MARAVIAASCLALLAIPAYPLQASATSLGQIAKKEKERRAETRAAKWSFTNADLGMASGFPGSAPAEEGSAGQAAVAGKGEDERAKKQADYQAQVDEEVRKKTALRKAIDNAQLELNDLGNYTFGPRRGSLMELIDNCTAEIAKIDRTLEEIQDKARRDGITVSVP